MKNFKYFKISKTKKLRYLDNYYKKNLYIIFLPGFQSDIVGEKPQAFLKYAIRKKLGSNIGLRFTPRLYFKIDSLASEAKKIDDLFKNPKVAQDL